MERNDRRRMSYELEQLRDENFQLEEKIQHQENKIAQVTYEMQQLRNENFQLEEKIQHKENEIAQITYELEQLQHENLQLKEKIQHMENDNAQLKHDLQMSNDKIRKMVEIINELKQKYDNLVKEKKWLFSRIEQLKAKECDKNCVIDVMLWICQTKVTGEDVQLCGRQLEKIIIKYAGDKIEKEDLKCEQLMEILRKCEIVAEAAEYKYPSEMNAKLRAIDEAWNRLMTTDGNERVLILGRVIANNRGHAEVCDLDTRGDGRVTIHNPHKGKWENCNQEDFREYVFEDERLILYSVNLEKLKQIIEEHEDILHRTNQSGQALTIAPSAIL